MENTVNQTGLDIIKAQYEMNEKTLKDTERKLKDRLKDDGSKLYTPAQLEERLVPLRAILEDTLQLYIKEGGKTTE